MAEFDPWAAYYDFLHPGLPGEAVFYAGQALKRGCPVLEIGCGTGRIAIPIAMSELHVTGLDNSTAMLALCREKAKQVGVKKKFLSLVQADMRDFNLGEDYPLIIMAYRTFMHCLSLEEQLACLHGVYNHLVPGGEFFCNVWAAQPASIVRFDTAPNHDRGMPAARIPLPDEEVVLVHLVTVWRDDFRQLLHERHCVQEQDETGAILHEEELSMTRAWTTPREMEHLLARAGFEILAVLGDFEGDLLRSHHTEMVWHVRRPLS